MAFGPVVSAGAGTRVALVGLTPPWTERLLKANGLGNMKVVDEKTAFDDLMGTKKG